jgi:hypothetical protein
LKLKVTVVDQLHPFGSGLDRGQLEFRLRKRRKVQSEKNKGDHPANQLSYTSRERLCRGLAGCEKTEFWKLPYAFVIAGLWDGPQFAHNRFLLTVPRQQNQPEPSGHLWPLPVLWSDRLPPPLVPSNEATG